MRSTSRSSSGFRLVPSGSPAPSAGTVERGPALAGDAVDDREVELVDVGVEVEEQLLDLVDHLGHPRVGAVDLVDHEDDRQLGLERLAQHEPGLGQRPLGRVDEQQHAVDHRQPALDLAAEVGVARCVDDVDLHVAVLDRRVLGEDGDALLALEVHRVHDALADVLVVTEGARLPEHLVDEGGLAVVDVGHDGHVAQVGAGLHWRGPVLRALRKRSGGWSGRVPGTDQPTACAGGSRSPASGPRTGPTVPDPLDRQAWTPWKPCTRPGRCGGSRPNRCRTTCRPRSSTPPSGRRAAATPRTGASCWSTTPR